MAITDKLKSYALKAAGAAVCLALVWGNFQILDTKNKHIEDLKKTISTVTAEKEAIATVLTNKVNSDKVTTTVVEEVKVAEAKPEKAKTQANKYVENKLATIEQTYAAKEQTAANAERKRMEISLERAKGIWLAYCLQEPEEKSCK